MSKFNQTRDRILVVLLSFLPSFHIFPGQPERIGQYGVELYTKRINISHLYTKKINSHQKKPRDHNYSYKK